MFIEKRKLNTIKNDANNNSINIEKTIYLFEGQKPNSKNLHQSVQTYYKKLFIKQEEQMLLLGRPISILEILNPIE